MKITTEMIKRLQQIELKMLEIFIQICEKENLKYYLSGGTLLGAVRHKGFIPWDDDIDVRMPRIDYEKFLLCANKYLPDYYFLQTYKTEYETPFGFAKIRDNRTIYKEKAIKNFNINHGVWIDIFPLDFCPRHCFLFNIYRVFLQNRIQSRFDIKKTPKQKFLQFVSYFICPSYDEAVFVLEKYLQFYRKDTGLMANFYGGKKDIMPTKWYGEGIELTFEHLKVKGPKEYNKYLTQLYGDYMRLPPKEKRIPVHEISEIRL